MTTDKWARRRAKEVIALYGDVRSGPRPVLVELTDRIAAALAAAHEAGRRAGLEQAIAAVCRYCRKGQKPHRPIGTVLGGLWHGRDLCEAERIHALADAGPPAAGAAGEGG